MDYFVKESHGFIWHFYHNAHGICFCKMKDENITEYQVLVPDGCDDFDVIADDSDCIHIVCQNQNGDIMYINHFNGQWRKTTLLKSKNPSPYQKDFAIRRINNWLNLFYCIEYNGNRMLTHHIVDRNDVAPNVIDCIKGDFCTAQSRLGDIYLLFYSETNKNWGTRKYQWSKKEWQDFEPIEQIDGCQNAFLYIDGKDKMHVVFEIELCIKEYFDGEVYVHGTGQKPMMLYQNETIIMWEGIGDSKIYIKRETDQTPTVFMPGGFSKPVRFNLRYTSYEPNISADCCLGSITNGSVKTYGIKNFFVVSDKPVVPAGTLHGNNTTSDPDNSVFVEIQKMKIQLRQLGMMLDRLESRTEGLEVQKINRKLDEIEEAVNKNSKNRFLNLF